MTDFPLTAKAGGRQQAEAGTMEQRMIWALIAAAAIIFAALAGWFGYSKHAAMRTDFGGTPKIERL